ncbi:spirocyclase AveC family protein [Actinomycetospora endophytica]|uniref:Spirocyclase AveC family protein n=1 Tax=Actinomycetospora endophytica TaxID=2291215 RepID=A0ABS8PJ08_9PSEU|nr:spirocyclase AveC family protein [Actinomycetospora endophytica]MCD2198255.1 spirocyclase AveC family protein [Actinomycetospora endophytica]
MFVVQALARWVASGTEFGPAPILDSDTFDGVQLMLLRVIEVASVLVLIATVWVFLVRPYLAHRRLGLDGKIVIGSLLAAAIDPLINYFHYTFAWNAHAWNLGSWLGSFPLAQGPTHYGEGLAWFIPQYLYLGIGLASIEGRIILALRRRYPGVPDVRAFAVASGSIFIADCLLEQVFIRAGVYAFPRTWSALTLFAGTPYQFPIYESLFVAVYATGFTALRMSALDHPSGLSFVERGVERWRPSLQTPITLLGVIGFCAVWAALAYFLPWSWMSNNPDSLIHIPSYMTPGPPSH